MHNRCCVRKRQGCMRVSHARVRRAADVRLRSGYAPRPRRKCRPRSSWASSVGLTRSSAVAHDAFASGGRFELCGRRRLPGRRLSCGCVERDAGRHGVGYGYVQVGWVSRVRCRTPTVLSARPSHESRVRAVRASEVGKTSKRGLKVGCAHERSVFLSSRTQCALGEGDASARVVSAKVRYGRHKPQRSETRVQEQRRGHVAPVCWVLEEVFSSCVASRTEKGDSALDEKIVLLEFSLVVRQHVGESHYVFAVADRRWSAVGDVGREEPADRER
eukprot:2277720-Pleurochrysis_carterae.AAC.1